MTDEQINQRIAEVCGWTEKPRRMPDGLWYYGHCPDYCTDLNAMHEAEKVLAPKNWNNFSEKWWDYCDFLTFCCNHDTKQSFHATARQRAEAFLRTLGKWQATDKDSLTVQPTTEQSSVDHLRDATKLMSKEVQK